MGVGVGGDIVGSDEGSQRVCMVIVWCVSVGGCVERRRNFALKHNLSCTVYLGIMTRCIVGIPQPCSLASQTMLSLNVA